MKKKPTERVAVLVRVPPALLKKIDSASAAEGRSRTSEVCLRLASTFKRDKSGAAA